MLHVNYSSKRVQPVPTLYSINFEKRKNQDDEQQLASSSKKLSTHQETDCQTANHWQISGSESFADFINKIIHRNQLNADEWMLAMKQQKAIKNFSKKPIAKIYDQKQRCYRGKRFDFYCSNKPVIKSDFNSKAISQIYKMFQNYGEVSMIARGQSMFPYIQEGDSCLFCSYHSKAMKRGQVVLYRTEWDQLIAHRYLGRKGVVLNKEHYFLKGDSNCKIDEPVYSEQILGFLVSIQTFDHSNRLSHRFHQCWNWMILHLPILSWSLNKYLLIRLWLRRPAHRVY